MNPQDLPSNIHLIYPEGKFYQIGPPVEVPGEECGTVDAIRDTVHGGFFDGMPVFRTYYKPDAEELKALNEDGLVEISFYLEAMPMHSVVVFGNLDKASE